MNIHRKSLLLTALGLVVFVPLVAQAQSPDSLQSDTLGVHMLGGLTVSARRAGTSRKTGVENGVNIHREELFKAACCNLGESFVTNPSVDVNYTDAATGARQIRLLGLSGTYVQILTENIPNFRVLALPYALDYVPGPWMSGIQLSKGASSVRNGYESITGQIDIEYLKPDDEPGITVNLYGNTLSRFEANADANIHLNERLSTEVLAHYQDEYAHHDQNDDGFLDQPNVRQYNLQNRWKLKNEHYLMHAGASLLREDRNGGQTHHTAHGTTQLYKTDLETERYEAYMKHAFILDSERGTNIALMASGSLHSLDALYGRKTYDADQRNGYAQLLFETNLGEKHNLSTGLSVNHDYLKQHGGERERETTTGIYAQYTYTLGTRLTAMAGLRADYSSRYDGFVTPRIHLKYAPADFVTLRVSAGKGYRTVHALAENNFLLSSGRELKIDRLKQESAWNYGASSAFYIPLFGHTLRLNAEYYRTEFCHQAVIDYDTDPTQIRITNLQGDSYSNTFQIDASYPVVEGLELSAAWRLNDVKTTYGGRLREKPLTSRYKALFSASYKTPLGLWQFDTTLQLNGGGRMPTPVNGAWNERFHHYEQLSAQVTRWFRHWSVYVGGENLTARRQHHVIIDADRPWSETFDPTMVWGPVHGAVGYLGVRINFGRM